MKLQNLTRPKPPLASMIFFSLVLLINAGAPRETRAQRPDSTKAATIQYAAIEAAREAAQKLKTKKLDKIEAKYEGIILGDVQRHAQSEASKKLLSDRFKEDLYNSLNEDLKVIVKSFNPQSSDKMWFTEGWLADYVKTNLKAQIERDILENHYQNFSGVFATARNSAKQTQLKQLTLAVYPSPPEVQNYYKSNWSTQSREALARSLVERMRNGRILLEENTRQLEGISLQFVDEVREQFQRQMSALENKTGADARTETQIITAMHANVQTVIGQIKQTARPNQKVYEIFPIIQENINAKAKLIEASKFEEFGKTFKYTINNASLKSLIEADMGGHRIFGESLSLCCKSLFLSAASEVARTYASGLRNSSEASAFENKLKQMISNNKNVKEVLEQGIRNAMEKPLRDLRSGIAEQQMQAHFPRVASRTWQAPETVLERIYKREINTSNLEEVIDLPNIGQGGKPYTRRMLLVETDSAFFLKMTELISEGENAWHGQLNIVNRYENVIENVISVCPENKNYKKLDFVLFFYYIIITKTFKIKTIKALL